MAGGYQITDTRDAIAEDLQRVVLNDSYGNEVSFLTSRTIALARTVNATLSSAQTITLNTSTTVIRVYAIAQDVYLKWGATAVTASNFDEVVPAGQICDFFVPFSSGTVLYTSLSLIERQASATVIVIEK